MPRADSKQHLGPQFYHAQFPNSSYLPDSSPSSSPPAATATSTPKKKHVCATCERAFTTSGHLARHSRVHTGERNHKCPFPGCDTRCSRQDNLQQHYRIHLSPGSRRSSARSAASKAMNGKKGTSNVVASTESLAPSPLSPPPLEPARIYTHHSTPPDSPPPLAQATLPATASISLATSRMHQSSPGRSSSSSSSPDTCYSPNDHHHLVALQSQGLSNLDYNNYRSGTTTYQEQSQAPTGYTYVHTTAHDPQSHTTTTTHDHHPQSHTAHHHHPILSQQHYHSNGHSTGRFNSPPPTLAPIHGERLVRRLDDSRHHHPSPYIHTQTVGDYSYHQGMGLGHGAWKAESGMRRGIGTALV